MRNWLQFNVWNRIKLYWVCLVGGTLYGVTVKGLSGPIQIRFVKDVALLHCAFYYRRYVPLVAEIVHSERVMLNGCAFFVPGALSRPIEDFSGRVEGHRTFGVVEVKP